MNFTQRMINNLSKNIGMPTAQTVRQAEDMNSESFLEWIGVKGKRNDALSEITYYTCLKMLSETLAKMPIKYYKRTDKGAVEVRDDETAYLFRKRPNPYMTPTVLWNSCEVNRNHYGNAYVWLQRKFAPQKYGGELKTVGLWLMPSENVKVLIDDAGIFAGKGSIWYWYIDKYSGESYVFPNYDVMHFKTSVSIDGITGLPVREILRQNVEGNIASQEYMNNLYKQGLTAKAVLEYTGEINAEAKEKLRKAFEDFGNGSKNTGRIMPVPLGFKLTPLDIKLTDSQFYELKKYSALQLGAAFGIKPNHLNDYEKSSYNNSEYQNLAFYVDTMLYIIKMYEEEINYKAVQPDKEGIYYYKFNEKVTLRTDSKTQTEIWATKIDKGMLAPNEARRMDDLTDAEGGDRLIVNGTYVPLEDVGKQYGIGEGEPQETGREPPPDGGNAPQKTREGGKGIEKKTGI